MRKSVKNAKIALLDMNLQKAKMSLGVQVVIEDPNQIEEIKARCVCRREPRGWALSARHLLAASLTPGTIPSTGSYEAART